MNPSRIVIQSRVSKGAKRMAEAEPPVGQAGAPAFVPVADVYELEGALVIRLAVPGALEEDIDISFGPGGVTVRGETEAPIIERLSHEPVHIDDLARQLALPVAQVSSTLAMMEIRGQVKQVGGMHYIRVREALAGYGTQS